MTALYFFAFPPVVVTALFVGGEGVLLSPHSIKMGDVMAWVYLVIAILSEVLATSFLKSTQEFTRPVPTLLVLMGYGLSFYFLNLSLRSLPVGIAYAIWAGLGIVLVTLFGWLFYQQKLDTPAFIGISLILSGVLVINLLSKSAVH